MKPRLQRISEWPFDVFCTGVVVIIMLIRPRVVARAFRAVLRLFTYP